jgi:hypothetical protein
MFGGLRPPYTGPMKTRFVPACVALNLALSAAAWAAADPPLGALLACRSIPDTAARLACFDRESASIASATSHSSALTQNSSGGAASSAPAAPASSLAAPARSATPPDVAPAAAATASGAPAAANAPSAAANASTPPAALDPVATFGLPLQTIAARENAAGLRKKDLQSITAHIARISSGSSGRMVFDLDNHQAWQQIGSEGDLMAKPGDEVKIWRGMLGSFWLQASTGRGCKVTRLE